MENRFELLFAGEDRKRRIAKQTNDCPTNSPEITLNVTLCGSEGSPNSPLNRLSICPLPVELPRPEATLACSDDPL